MDIFESTFAALDQQAEMLAAARDKGAVAVDEALDKLAEQQAISLANNPNTLTLCQCAHALRVGLQLEQLPTDWRNVLERGAPGFWRSLSVVSMPLASTPQRASASTIPLLTLSNARSDADLQRTAQ